MSQRIVVCFLNGGQILSQLPDSPNSYQFVTESWLVIYTRLLNEALWTFVYWGIGDSSREEGLQQYFLRL